MNGEQVFELGIAGEIIIFGYLAIIFAIGIFMARYIKDFRDYLMGAGKLGMILLAGTVLATQWGGVTFLGISGFAYQNLYQGVWYAWGAAARFLFWAFFLAVVIRKVRPYTVSEWFAARFDVKNGLLISLMNLIVGLGLLGSQFVAIGTIAHTFMGWDLETAIVLGAILVTIYTVASGIVGVAATDIVQIVVSLLGAIIMIIAANIEFGSFAEVREVLPAEFFDHAEPWGFVFMITIFFLWLADLPLQYANQRMISARTTKIAFYAPIFGALSYLLVTYITPALGAYARVALPELEVADAAFPQLTAYLLPGPLAGLVAAALLAVIMSSGDSYLLGPSTLVINDFYRAFKPEASQRQVLFYARIATIVYLLLGLWAALAFQVIIGLILTFLVFGWAILPAYFASTMSRKVTASASFWSILVGGVINGILITWPPEAFADYPRYYTGWIGFAAAIVILVVGTLLSKKKGDEAISDAIKQMP